MPCGVLQRQQKLEFYNMNVFKCFAYPVCWLTVQGFTCLQIKWGHTAPKSCFPFFSTFLLFEIPLECNCASVGLQNVSESFTNSAGTSGGKKSPIWNTTKENITVASKALYSFFLTLSAIILPAQHTWNWHQRQDPYTSWIGILVDYARKRFGFPITSNGSIYSTRP